MAQLHAGNACLTGERDLTGIAARHFLFSAIGLATLLTGCGGTDDLEKPLSITITTPQAYSIGGSVAGLSGTVVLQDNGGDNLSLSTNTAFTFSVPLQPNASYDVTVASQPASETCSVSNGTGKATASITNVTVVCRSSSAVSDTWTWVTGSSYVNAPGVYGTAGTAAAANTPGARRQPVAWTDAAGNFWLFGGSSAGDAGTLNDLWKYSPAAGQWSWQGGSQTTSAPASYGSQGLAAAGNNPGAREGAAEWTDAAGNLWMFGGDNLAGQSWGEFNDLWSYNPSNGMWTWVGGSTTAASPGDYGTIGVPAASNLPPARTDAVNWVDSAGVLWLFGGVRLNPNGSYLAVLNDLWNYNPATGLWTWVGGSNVPGAAGVYGTQGIAAAGDLPGARMGSSAWVDTSGNLWLFGGLGLGSNGLAQDYNDLWEYSPSSGEWTWVSGSDAPDAAAVYGTQGASSAGNTPGARASAVSWKDSSGNFWLLGGHGYAQGGSLGSLNDLWEYNIGLAAWIWMGGSSSAAASGIYGAKDVPAPSNAPGAREQAVGWSDSSGNFWMFGGFGFDLSGVQGNLNDLWSLNSP
jgi:N-acetylneuraminic acid mutarotase